MPIRATVGSHDGRVRLLILLLVCLGGALGTGLRFLVATAAVRWLGPEFPYGTAIVNLVGSFLIGLVQQTSAEAGAIPEDARLVVTAGMLGGLTTYSAFSYETLRLMQAGGWLQAALNVLGTTAGCLGLCFLGVLTGRLLLGLRG